MNVVVESPRGSAVKFKYDIEHSVLTVSRPLPLGLVYPYDWGFVPSTRAKDGDPLDAWVAWDVSSYPGIVIPCRTLGLLQVEQRDASSGGGYERNDRLAMLPLKAHRQEGLQSVFDLPERVRLEIERFFQNTAAFEEKEVRILGWAGGEAAEEAVRRALEGQARSRARRRPQPISER
jgi:inorganic pyrophosphatase